MNNKEAMTLLLQDRPLFIETLVEIEDKNRDLVPYKLNLIQQDMAYSSTGRDIYVKPAQVGASSYFICDFLIDCITQPGTTAVIISYDEFITGRLLRKAQAFYDALKKRIPSIPDLHHKSASEMTFKGMNSSLYIASARSFSLPRGEPIHNLLLDEFGFWVVGAAEGVMTAAIQRVPLLPNTKIRILSTPNGIDNDFYEAYMAAKEGKDIGKSVFKSHFYPWFMHHENTMLYEDSFVLPGDDKPILDNLDPDEEKVMMKIMTMFPDMEEVEVHSKLRWRRYKNAEMSSLRRSGETRLLFGQEHPEDDVSCFQSAGDMWYDPELIIEKTKDCYPAPAHKLFADIWEAPQDGLKYLVSVDPGLGKQSESVAQAWTFNLDFFRHVATMSGLYEDKDMADKSMDFARYYNNAMIANEDSLGITAHLKDYPNLYYRIDPITGKMGKNIGWQTNRSTKPYMCNELQRHLPKIETHDIRFISQLRNIRDVGGRATAVGADDHHDSACIAIVCRESLPIERGLLHQSGWSDSWGQ